MAGTSKHTYCAQCFSAIFPRIYAIILIKMSTNLKAAIQTLIMQK